VDYFKRLGNDYIAVFRDTAGDIAKRPGRACLLLLAGASTTAICVSCPHESAFDAQLLSYSVDLWDTPRELQSRRAVAHIESCLIHRRHGQLRHVNLGFLHLVWCDDRPKPCALYSEICPYNYPAGGTKSSIRGLFNCFLYDQPRTCPPFTVLQRISHVLRNRIVDVGSGPKKLQQLCRRSSSDVIDSDDILPSSSSSQKAEVVGDFVKVLGSSEDLSESARLPKENGTEKPTSSTVQDEADADEWEVMEETLLHVNCVGAIERDLIQPGRPVLMVDIDTETPLLQIGQAIFHGTYKQTLGTSLFFEKHSPAAAKDFSEKSLTESIGVFSSFQKPSSRPQFTYFGKTSKLLDLQRVFLKPKESGE
ncbi:unnamed protein product, partial [Schistocephalus solidus]|uniref:TFIIIC_sub6 domain-containing protein n=1 Tax=Schistocephalus solidus TaxID=70667 RepID=A0A183TS06_SCHSO